MPEIITIIILIGIVYLIGYEHGKNYDTKRTTSNIWNTNREETTGTTGLLKETIP